MHPSKFFYATLSSSILAIMFILVSSGYTLESASNHYLAGIEFLRNGQPDKAADKFEDAFGIRLGDEKIHYSLGVTLLKKLPRPDYQHLIELFSDLDRGSDLHSGSSLYWLGVAYKESRNYGEALKRLEKAKEKGSRYVSKKRIKNTIQSINGLWPIPQPSQGTWWKNLVMLAAILFISFLFVFGLKKWVLVDGKKPENRFYTHNIFIFVVVALVLVFSALVMKLIDGDQFMNLLKIIMKLVR